MKKLSKIEDIGKNHLCCGCGVCSYLSPDTIRMVDDYKVGRRPVIKSNQAMSPEQEMQLLNTCPGFGVDYSTLYSDATGIKVLKNDWGPILHIYEGYATEKDLRFRASSGGAVSAIAISAIENGSHGVLHVSKKENVPYLNYTVLSNSRTEMSSRSGSRYAPASPCEGLQKVVDSPLPCVLIGKPCDIAAARKASKIKPELEKKIDLTIAVFCAATPSTNGTFALLESLGIKDFNDVNELRYRGFGWPGNARAAFNKNGTPGHTEMSYAESWGSILCHFRQWRCNLCVDHTGEFADISIGDPWYRKNVSDDPGRSLILCRTIKGKDFIEKAVKSGDLLIENSVPDVLPRSQQSLLNTRRSVWGRLLAMKLAGLHTPVIKGIPMLTPWLKYLTTRQKAQSFIGTLKRIKKYNLTRPYQVVASNERET